MSDSDSDGTPGSDRPSGCLPRVLLRWGDRSESCLLGGVGAEGWEDDVYDPD